MRSIILSAILLMVFVTNAFAGITTSLPFTSMTMTTDIGANYGMAKIIMECSSAKDNFSREMTALKIITKDADFIAPTSVISKFRNPGDVQIHGGIEEPEVNIYVHYESQPHIFMNGHIQFKNGKFRIVDLNF